MTPKEKAFRIYEIIRFDISLLKGTEALINEVAKRCALITVDEILDLDLHSVGDYRNDQASSDDFSTVTWYINYWEEVKQEIEQI